MKECKYFVSAVLASGMELGLRYRLKEWNKDDGKFELSVKKQSIYPCLPYVGCWRSL